MFKFYRTIIYVPLTCKWVCLIMSDSPLLFIPPPMQMTITPLLDLLPWSPNCLPSPYPTELYLTKTNHSFSALGISFQGEDKSPLWGLHSGFLLFCILASLALFQFLLFTVLAFVCSSAIIPCPFITAQGHFKEVPHLLTRT